MNNRSPKAKITSKRPTSSSASGYLTVERYLQRAQAYAENKDYKQAIFELRQAIKAYPNSALCHSTLSVVYLQANQGTMAGVHAKRSLALDPTNQLAMKIQQKLEKHKPDHIKRKQIQETVKEGGIRGLLNKKLF